mgnify:FL=1
MISDHNRKSEAKKMKEMSMRKFGEYVRAAYGCFSAKWIFGVLAALSLLSALTKTVLLCIKKPEITPIERKGFTVVEWGGAVLD